MLIEGNDVFFRMRWRSGASDSGVVGKRRVMA
jgi:hypothetical protein